MKILYISYDGMTDPLGQSQVLPYLCGLSRMGCHISLISAEKSDAFAKRRNHIENITAQYNIHWHPVPYTRKPPVLSTLRDMRAMRRKALSLHKEQHFDMVHCRSYIAALIGLYFKKHLSVPFIFDMRGFWADERVEGGIWNLKNPVFRLVYNYFKFKEKQFLNHAAHIVSLTERGKEILAGWMQGFKGPAVSVIPCCADTDLFCRTNISESLRMEFKEKLGIGSDIRLISYLGSLGTWYMPAEMMDFFRVLNGKYPAFRFLLITPDAPEEIGKLALTRGVDPKLLYIIKADREEVPALLSLSEVSLFFIKPVFSKQASSPTKQAEILSLGIPVICNDGIGDTGPIIRQNKAGLVIESFDDTAYEEAAAQIDALGQLRPEDIRRTALALFSLESGVKKYYAIYQSISLQSRNIKSPLKTGTGNN